MNSGAMEPWIQASSSGPNSVPMEMASRSRNGVAWAPLPEDVLCIPFPSVAEHQAELRNDILEAYEARGGPWRLRGDAEGYNFDVAGDLRPGLVRQLHEEFLAACKEYYDFFEVEPVDSDGAVKSLEPQAKQRGQLEPVWAYVSTRYDQHVRLHNHARGQTRSGGADIVGVVYLTQPDEAAGIVFLVDGHPRCCWVTEGFLYLWPGELYHTPMATSAEAPRISLNLELRTRDGRTPKQKIREKP